MGWGAEMKSFEARFPPHPPTRIGFRGLFCLALKKCFSLHFSVWQKEFFLTRHFCWYETVLNFQTFLYDCFVGVLPFTLQEPLRTPHLSLQCKNADCWTASAHRSSWNPTISCVVWSTSTPVLVQGRAKAAVIAFTQSYVWVLWSRQQNKRLPFTMYTLSFATVSTDSRLRARKGIYMILVCTSTCYQTHKTIKCWFFTYACLHWRNIVCRFPACIFRALLLQRHRRPLLSQLKCSCLSRKCRESRLLRRPLLWWSCCVRSSRDWKSRSRDMWFSSPWLR